MADKAPTLLGRQQSARPCLANNEHDLISVEKGNRRLLSSTPATIQVNCEVRRLKIMCITTPEAGHLIPTMNVAVAAAQRGHRCQLVSCAFAGSKVKGQCERARCEFVGVAEHVMSADSGRGEAAELLAKNWMVAMFTYYDDAIYGPAKELARKERPDIIVADFITPCAWKIADELGIPVAIECPGALCFCSAFTELNPWRLYASVRWRLGRREADAWWKLITEVRDVWYTKPWLVNTFFGFEPPMPLLPNKFVTGSTAPRHVGQIQHTSLQPFNEWLDWVRTENLKVVYVTMGSMQVLEKFQVMALYEGLSSVPGCAVAWSLKDEQQKFLPSHGAQGMSKKFFINKWMPQAEALQLPDVALVITHCGWGGLNETISAAKPVVATPFRADQPANSAAVKARGLGEVLDPAKLSSAAVHDAVVKVLQEPSYAKCAKELQESLFKTGGAKRCVEVVEHIAKCGYSDIVTQPPPLPSMSSVLRRPITIMGLGAAIFAFGALCAKAAACKTK